MPNCCYSIDSVMAANLMPFFLVMCEIFSGIIHPQDEMPAFWAYTMYYVTPFTYWVGGILSAILTGQPVICEQGELVTFEAPPLQTCQEYAKSWLDVSAGYLQNPDNMGSCQYCPYSQGDDVSCQLSLSLIAFLE